MPRSSSRHPPFQPGPLELAAVSLAHLIAETERGENLDWGSLAKAAQELAQKLQERADAET